MATRSPAERVRVLREFRKEHAGRVAPVEIDPPGAHAPKMPTKQARRAVQQMLQEHVQQAAALSYDEMRLMLPVFQQAETELAHQLKRWIKRTPDGELRWTAQHYRTALVQIKATAGMLEDALNKRLTVGTLKAQHLSLQHLVKEIARFSEVFHGSVRNVNLNTALLIANRRSWVVDRFENSVHRYAWQSKSGQSVAQDIRQRLAVDILKGEPIRKTVDRLVEHGGPRGVVALQGVVGESTAVVELIPEGLFKRYRSWAQRLVRTETASAYNMQNLDGIDAASEEVPGLMKRWCADGGGCPTICDSIDGQVVETDDVFSTPVGAVDAPPAHPNCRCRCGAWHRDWPRLFSSVAGQSFNEAEPQIER